MVIVGPSIRDSALVIHRSVILFSLIMKSSMGLQHRNGKPLFLLACIVAALCFSAGEGLRLTPFPANDLAGTTLREGQLGDRGTGETSTPKYGPIDLPKRTQARNKHKVFDVDCLSAPIAFSAPSPFCNLPVVADTTDVASLQVISPARDRAPPFPLS